ncbi:MAG: hypothetical protein FWD83_00325 [Promicromonosporaceae bacterium]|nr:hypothetical protein [Promicromonosporaceae bacterium]
MHEVDQIDGLAELTENSLGRTSHQVCCRAMPQESDDNVSGIHDLLDDLEPVLAGLPVLRNHRQTPSAKLMDAPADIWQELCEPAAGRSVFFTPYN